MYLPCVGSQKSKTKDVMFTTNSNSQWTAFHNNHTKNQCQINHHGFPKVSRKKNPLQFKAGLQSFWKGCTCTAAQHNW